MHNRIVVVNSTPIIALSVINKLHLFKDLYGEIIIPKAVQDEVGAKKDSVSQLALARAKDWIITKTITNNAAKKFFKVQLHDGEVEVMILGKELDGFAQADGYQNGPHCSAQKRPPKGSFFFCAHEDHSN